MANAKKVTKKVTSGKDKALMSVIRDCSLNPWCSHSMTITDKMITYQKPKKGVSFLELFQELKGAEASCEVVEVKL
jgi:hypothetical protein